MEFKIICDNCKKVYYVVLEEYEKIVKLAERKRVDFSETKLENETKMSVKCPDCGHFNVYKMDQIKKSWYILYNLSINCTPSKEETEKANEILVELLKADNTNPSEKDNIIKLIQKLNEIEILGVISKNSNMIITLEEFNEAIKDIEESYQ